MEIKITIEDIEENELRTYGRLGKVFAHLLGEGECERDSLHGRRGV